MKARSICVSLLALAMSVAAVAGEHHRKRVEIHVDTDGDTGFHFDSESAGFDPLELQLGESRSIVDENGNTLFIVRTESGFEIDVDGHKIEIPDPGNLDEAALADLHEADKSGEHELRIMRRIRTEGDADATHEVHREVVIVQEEQDETN